MSRYSQIFLVSRSKKRANQALIIDVQSKWYSTEWKYFEKLFYHCLSYALTSFDFTLHLYKKTILLHLLSNAFKNDIRQCKKWFENTCGKNLAVTAQVESLSFTHSNAGDNIKRRKSKLIFKAFKDTQNTLPHFMNTYVMKFSSYY